MNPYESPKHYCLPTRTASNGLRGITISAVGSLLVSVAWLYAWFWFVDVRGFAQWHPVIAHGVMIGTTLPWLIAVFYFVMQLSRQERKSKNALSHLEQRPGPVHPGA